MNRKYFHFTRESENPAARLFCFHYAGGSPYSYVPWQKYINSEIDVFPFQMAGRCTRLAEKFSPSIETTADEAALAVSELADRKIILTGHSMGGVVAFYTAFLLKKIYGIKADKLFITASVPDLGMYIRKNYGSSEKFDDNQFCTMLLEFGAVDSKILKVRGFREQFLPVIRSDFSLIEKYRADINNIIDSDIAVFYGDSDRIVGKSAVMEWNKYTSGKVSITEYIGGHFFIKDYIQKICSQINCCI